MNVLIAKLGITIHIKNSSSLFTVSILLMPMIMKIILTIRDGIIAIYDWSVIYFVLLLLFSDLSKRMHFFGSMHFTCVISQSGIRDLGSN